MKATKEEIKDYCYMLFMMSNLDWNGYLALKQFEKKCLDKGEIIFP
jgi:hypothetical protein